MAFIHVHLGLTILGLASIDVLLMSVQLGMVTMGPLSAVHATICQSQILELAKEQAASGGRRLTGSEVQDELKSLCPATFDNTEDGKSWWSSTHLRRMQQTEVSRSAANSAALRLVRHLGTYGSARLPLRATQFCHAANEVSQFRH